MTDRHFNILIYTLTPVTLVAGLLVMYFLIGDHRWFGYMAAGYAVLIVILFFVKLSLFKRLARLQQRSQSESKHG